MIHAVARALFAFFFGIIWFVFCVAGVVVLVLPQIITNLNRRYDNVDWIASYISFMEKVFELVKES